MPSSTPILLPGMPAYPGVINPSHIGTLRCVCIVLLPYRRCPSQHECLSQLTFQVRETMLEPGLRTTEALYCNVEADVTWHVQHVSSYEMHAVAYAAETPSIWQNSRGAQMALFSSFTSTLAVGLVLTALINLDC